MINEHKKSNSKMADRNLQRYRHTGTDRNTDPVNLELEMDYLADHILNEYESNECDYDDKENFNAWTDVCSSFYLLNRIYEFFSFVGNNQLFEQLAGYVSPDTMVDSENKQRLLAAIPIDFQTLPLNLYEDVDLYDPGMVNNFASDFVLYFKITSEQTWKMKTRYELFSGDYSEIVTTIIRLYRFWVRPFWTWEPPQGDLKCRIHSLVHHIFVVYPVPAFLYRIWTIKYTSNDLERMWNHLPGQKWIYWFLLFAQGGSLHRASKRFSWNVRKGFEQYLCEVPAELSCTEATVYAAILSYGGSHVEYRRMRQCSFFARDFTAPLEGARINIFDEQLGASTVSFFRQTIEWLIRYRSEITDEMCRQILDWAVHIFTENGYYFSWSKRTPHSVFNAAQQYIRVQVDKSLPGIRLRWEGHGWDRTYQNTGRVDWAITEITNGAELYEEGKRMRHCVGSYCYLCHGGESAIFRITANGERRLTVQLNPHSKRIVQAHGLCNRFPVKEESELLQKWLDEVVLCKV